MPDAVSWSLPIRLPTRALSSGTTSASNHGLTLNQRILRGLGCGSGRRFGQNPRQSITVSVSDFSGSKVKRIADRPRPFQILETQTIQRSPASTDTSFYSNHATNNFAFATYMSFIFPEAKLVLFSFASVIAYSRVYNGVHYPSDVFAGAFMGIFWGFLFNYLLIKLFSVIQRKTT